MPSQFAAAACVAPDGCPIRVCAAAGNNLVWMRASSARRGPFSGSLTLRAAWGEGEAIWVGGRQLLLDDDSFLILNAATNHECAIRALQPVEALAVHFRPGLAAEISSALATGLDEALDGRDAPNAAAIADFAETLQPVNRIVTPVVLRLRRAMAEGRRERTWYEEQVHFLMARMLRHHRRTLECIESLPFARRATRREIHRRIGLAADFLHTSFQRDVTLAELARIACLSKFHFLRLFTLIRGMTPFDYLRCRRMSAAVRLLRTTNLTVDEIAQQIGYSSRGSIERHLRRHAGRSPRQIRQERAVVSPLRRPRWHGRVSNVVPANALER